MKRLVTRQSSPVTHGIACVYYRPQYMPGVFAEVQLCGMWCHHFVCRQRMPHVLKPLCPTAKVALLSAFKFAKRIPVRGLNSSLWCNTTAAQVRPNLSSGTGHATWTLTREIRGEGADGLHLFLLPFITKRKYTCRWTAANLPGT